MDGVGTIPPDTLGSPLAFIVRVSRGLDGRLAGVVERVRTGEKRRFEDPSAIGPLIEEMVSEEQAEP
jgi:hypothetical protein